MKVFFPKYLNRNRLFYKLEYDEWIVLAVSFFGIFYLLGFFLMINIIISLAASYFGTKKIFKYYTDTHKVASPGYLYHFFYDYGFSQPKDFEDDIELPYGYETEFED